MTKRGALKKTFVLTVGPPGAGKTTLVAKRYPDALVLCPDDEGTPASFAGFFKAVRVALAAGRRKQIAVDRTNPRLDQRTQLIDAAKAAGYPTEILYMPAVAEICIQRIMACKGHPLEGKNVGQALGRYFDDLVPPTDGEADRLETIGAPAIAPTPTTAAGQDISPTIIDKIVLLMIAGLRHQAVIDATREKLLVPPAQIDGAMDTARRLITRAADYDRDAVLGEAITRLDDLYQRCLRVQDIKTALAAQREKNRLLLSMAGPGPEAPAASETDDKAPQRRNTNIESDELADIVDAIETGIEPLGLTPAEDVNDTDAQLITLAAQEIVRLRLALKRATPKKRKQQTAANKKRPKSKKPKAEKGKTNEKR